MPIISVKLTNPLPSREQLDAVAKKITDIMVEDLGKNPERVVIDFTEIPSEGTYFGGKSVQSMREAAAKAGK